MKRFIRYLYEYEQGKRMRNVGFVKVEQGEDECVVHIHGKGLRMGSEKSLAIYLLFEDEGKCFGIWQGEADNINPAVNECISFTAENTGRPENYDKINGLVLENRDGRRYAALWDEKLMDISGMQIWSAKETAEEKEPQEIRNISLEETKRERPDNENEVKETQRADNEANVTDKEPLKEEIPEEDAAEVTESYPAEKKEPQDIMKSQDTVKPQPSDDVMGEIPAIRSEDLFFGEEPKKMRPKERWRIKKIQRTELAKLARCEWRLANNNFLLHGYYNYHHLILMEREEQLMLGVPGIYHEKEAAAAGAFGFAEFIAKDRLDIKLSPEECNEDNPFGYWCRPVKRAFRWE